MSTLFFVGLIFVFGSFMKFVSQKLKVLYVVGYLIFGVIIGPDVLNIVPKEFIYNTHVIIELSLAIISVLVGANLKYNILKTQWRQIAIISLFETFFAFLFITIAFYLLFSYLEFGFDKEYRLVVALLFGGLASATAPATILAITHELKFKNRFSSFLLGTVAMDNAFALIAFSFISMITDTLLSTYGFKIENFLILIPKTFFAIIIGAVGAAISVMIDNVFKNYSSIKTTSTLGMIFMVYALAEYWRLEPLLSALVMGIVMANLSKEFFLVKKEFDRHLKDIIFLLFFTISAMHLNLEFLITMPTVVVVYVVSRIIGKIFGVYIGGKVSDSTKFIQNNLGVALFPQAGIAIGLALSMQSEIYLEPIAPIIVNVIIATTIVHELLGPFFTRYVLKKSEKQLHNKPIIH